MAVRCYQAHVYVITSIYIKYSGLVRPRCHSQQRIENFDVGHCYPVTLKES